MRLRLSGFGIRNSEFGIRISDFGFRFQDSGDLFLDQGEERLALQSQLRCPPYHLTPTLIIIIITPIVRYHHHHHHQETGIAPSITPHNAAQRAERSTLNPNPEP